MRRIISILFCLTMIVSMLCVGTSAAEGTAINSASDFAKMEPDGKYYLNADLTITTTYEKAFNGVFDGNGHTITTSVPLFAEFNGLVKNLTIDGAEIRGNENLAAFAVFTFDGMKAENVVNKVDITVTGISADKTAGLVAGGILADSDLASMSYFRNCSNYGNISVLTEEVENESSGAHHATFAGGIVGRADGVELKYCYNNAPIVAPGNRAHVGGIVGRAAYNALMVTCDIIDCSNVADITSGYDAGGIAGNIGVSNNNIYVPYTITYCVNTGEITGGYRVGGFVGYCYASGANLTYYIEITSSVSIGNVKGARPATDLGGGTQYTFLSLFIGYSNSINNKIIGSLGVGELIPLTGEGYNTPYRCIMGCSSAKTAEMKLSDNYMYDNNTTEWYSYATADSNSAQRINIETAISEGKVTRCTLEELSSGAILAKLNAAADTPVFKQTTGTDPYPTIDLALREQRLSAEEPFDDPEETTTEPVVTTTKKDDQTTAPQGDETTAPQGDETTAPAGEDTTTAGGDEEKKSCKSAVLSGIAIVAILGSAIVLGKKR
ncbi:MAG: hypothetical protein ACOX31_02470 [Eubacteriales bacterium]|jgi:hypothetical protein